MRNARGLAIEITKAIPQSIAQEWISIAYVQAIAAQAGLNTKNCRWDDGIDMDIGSNKRLPGFPNIRNLYLLLQLKSTTNWEIKNGHIHFALKASNYTMLRDPDSHLPQYLVLYTMPPSRVQWIRYRESFSEFRDIAYYLSLRDFPDLKPRADGKPRATKTVRVPVDNRLTGASLLRLYRQECERVVSLRGTG